MSGTPVLVIDDDPAILRLVEHALTAEGMPTVLCKDGAEAISAFSRSDLGAVVLDLMLPDISGKDLLARLQQERPALPVVVLTAKDSLEDVVDCMRLGAVDYVQKPFDRTRLVTSIRHAQKTGTLQRNVEALTQELRSGQGIETIRGESPAIKKSIALLERGAESDVTVLLLGESGTGKEVAARAIHAESARRTGPFVAVNCGAIPEGLIESELFGHEKGSFTGAVAARKGRFEEAHGGSVFLDEIGELRPDLQVKLLRVLQERVVQPVGGSERAVDVRVLSATNRDLKAASADRSFREDLYYRLSVFPIELPPLRDRAGDVPLLAQLFLERFTAEHRRALSGFSPEATAALDAYPWPGNVRELENVIERAVILEDGPRISLGSLPDDVVCAIEPAPTASQPSASPAASLEDIELLDEVERRCITRALELTAWNVTEAASRLGIGRATLYRKIERYRLRS